MNKNFFIIGGVILLVLLGGGAYMMLNRSETKSATVIQATITSTPAAMKTTEKKSLKDLMAMGDHQACTYTDEKTGSTGTIYIGKGDVRGDFSSQVNGKTVQSHMIENATDMYIWTDEQKQGMKVSLTAAKKVAGNVDMKTIDLNQTVSYSCKAWSIEPGSFDVPSEVTFQDFSKMMNDVGNMKLQTTGNPSNVAACSACDNLPADSQPQCKAALHCN